MAASKKEEFKTEDIWLADIAKALSHPARIRILKMLTEMNVCMCGDIVDTTSIIAINSFSAFKRTKTC